MSLLGYGVGRMFWPERELERALVLEWLKWNKEQSTRFLFNILQTTEPDHPDGRVTERDQRIAATIIQWLGTRVGTAFLRRAFKEAGYEIVQTRTTAQRV